MDKNNLKKISNMIDNVFTLKKELNEQLINKGIVNKDFFNTLDKIEKNLKLYLEKFRKEDILPKDIEKIYQFTIDSRNYIWNLDLNIEMFKIEIEYQKNTIKAEANIESFDFNTWKINRTKETQIKSVEEYWFNIFLSYLKDLSTRIKSLEKRLEQFSIFISSKMKFDWFQFANAGRINS